MLCVTNFWDRIYQSRVIEATGKEERSCEGEDCGIASERLAFEPKAREIGPSIRPQSGANRSCGTRPEDGDAWAD